MVFNAQDLVSRGARVLIVTSGGTEVDRRFSDAGLAIEAMPSLTTISSNRFLQRLRASLECRLKWANSPHAARLLLAFCHRELSLLKTIIRDRGVDALYCNMGAANDYQFIRAANRTGVATLSHQRREPPEFASRFVLGDVNAACTAFISNSEWTKSQWVEQGLRSDRHEVIYNTMLEQSGSRSRQLRDSLCLPPDARILASIGRLSREKSFKTGISAFGEAAQQSSNWHYVIIGAGEEQTNLRQVANENSLRDRIHFAGEVKNAAACMDEIDILLHPTRNEPFGRVVAEAMLAGCLVVGHASGGVTEMITNGEEGLLFNDKDALPVILAEAMILAPCERMARNARNKIKSMCGRRNSERLAKVILAAIDANSPTERASANHVEELLP